MKDIFDLIMKFVDMIWPLLAAYKIIIIILNMIICIIEVLCAIPNPFAVIAALINLFTVCLPQFLSLFPIFWLIVLILTIIYLIILLVEYIIAKIIQLVLLILENIIALSSAFALSDEIGILAILAKLGAILCGFQNLFVLLVIFEAFFAIIRAVLAVASAIPPCSDSNTNCCAPPTCPGWIKNANLYTANTGVLQYLPELAFGPAPGAIAGLPAGFNLVQIERAESWQFYDPFATIYTQMQNINVAYDLPDGYSPTVYFPTTQTFTAMTPSAQAPYTVDLDLFYNPAQWDRVDSKGARNIKITGCVVLAAPSDYLLDYANNQIPELTGVAELAGGLAFESDGTTAIMLDGYQATLSTLIHLPPTISTTPPPLTPAGETTFTGLTYNFNINHPILMGNALITAGCVPSVAAARNFINTTFGSTAHFAQLNALQFPSPATAQACLASALADLQSNINTEQVATFQAATTACLNQLNNECTAAATSLIGIGFDPYTSSFTVTPSVQFTSLTIDVQVSLVETTGQLLTSGMPASMGPTIAAGITPTITFGTISDFVFDGYQYFNAQISSTAAGSGTIQIAYDGQTISTVNTHVPSITPLTLPYTFAYVPLPVKTGVGDTDGQPRFGPGDLARGSE